MNDLSALLDGTLPTTCEFLGKTISLEVYTAGLSRLTHEESIALREVIKRYASANERAVQLQKEIKVQEALIESGLAEGSVEHEEQKTKLTALQTEWNDLDTGSVEQMRVILPMMLKGWSLNGEPMQRNGEDYPPTSANLTTVPDGLLMAVGEAAQAIWQNPIMSESASGSEQKDSQITDLVANPTETTTPLAISD